MSVTIVKSGNNVTVDKKVSEVTINKNTTAAQFSQFSAAGDSGTSAITNNETLTFTGGTGITSSVSNDEVTLNIDGTVLQNDDIIDGGTF
jgi:hypothetical protein|tara:strand:+ start:1798 stop:2067 length:270 start_codon:yes stop_codon:yes gene_type:complete